MLVMQRRVHHAHCHGHDPGARRAAPGKPGEIAVPRLRPAPDQRGEPSEQHRHERRESHDAPLGERIDAANALWIADQARNDKLLLRVLSSYLKNASKRLKIRCWKAF